MGWPELSGPQGAKATGEFYTWLFVSLSTLSETRWPQRFRRKITMFLEKTGCLAPLVFNFSKPCGCSYMPDDEPRTCIEVGTEEG